MNKPAYHRLLSQTVDTVLETMFFAATLGPAEPERGDAVLAARVAFLGRPSGTLEVRLSVLSARLLAAGFLGEEEETLTDSQPGEVLCEMANMLCGSLVSTLESEETFALNSPELMPAGIEAAMDPAASPAVRQSFGLENGVLTVTLYLEKDT